MSGVTGILGTGASAQDRPWTVDERRLLERPCGSARVEVPSGCEMNAGQLVQLSVHERGVGSRCDAR